MTLLARRGSWSCAALAVLSACSPALDWRDVRPAGTAVSLQFPCRPVAQQRSLPLAGPPVDLALLACTAGGQTWALAHADLADPARVAPALTELRTSTLAKLGAAQTASAPLPFSVAGATPNTHSVRQRLHAQPAAAADGGGLQMELALFTHGTRVFQASVLGSSVPVDAADTFFASVRINP